jgi:hypothetical protein
MNNFNFRPYILALIVAMPFVALFSVTLIENESWKTIYGLVIMPLIVVGAGVSFYLFASSTKCPNCRKPINYHSHWFSSPSFPKKCEYCSHEI